MMTFYSNNLFDNATLTFISQNDNFPVTNIQDFIPSKVYETGNTLASEAIYIDLGNSETVTNLIIYNHNFNGTENSFNLYASNSAFISPAFTQAITVSSTINISFASKTYRYWWITFTKTVASDIRSIGRIYLGTNYEFDASGDPDYDGYTLTWNDPSVLGKSIGGQTFMEQKEQFRTIDLTFTGRPDTEKVALEAIYEANGTWYPLFIQILPTSTSEMNEVIYARITNNQAFKINSWQDDYNLPNWTYSMSLEEQI